MRKKSAKPVIYTIGHSTRTTKRFIDILHAHGIKKIVDVRTIPKSRHNPQFNQDELRASLAGVKIRYEHLKSLGGLRHAIKNSINLGWENASFRGFADYMQTDSFSRGLERLEKIAQKQTTAIMCAEAVPWRCHRSLIADALTKKKWLVLHIQSGKTVRPHKVTSFLRKRAGKLIYPRVDSNSSPRKY
jgi:uncharacterized protein (DUF488 family)